MCVFLRSMCLKFLLRDEFERLLCWLDHWLSCMLDCIHVCIFHSWKTGFKMWLDTSSIPPRHLAICWASQAFSYRNPNSFSIPGGSIEKALASSIASWHLVDWSSFYSWIWWIIARYLLDTSAVDKHFLDTSFVELYWVFYLSLLVRSEPHFTRYPSRLLSVFSPKLSHLTPISILKGLFKLFQYFLLLVSF